MRKISVKHAIICVQTFLERNNSKLAYYLHYIYILLMPCIIFVIYKINKMKEGEKGTDFRALLIYTRKKDNLS